MPQPRDAKPRRPKRKPRLPLHRRRRRRSPSPKPANAPNRSPRRRNAGSIAKQASPPRRRPPRAPPSTTAGHRCRSAAAAHAAGGVRCRRADAGQGAVRQPGGAPVRARTRRRPGAGAGQRARWPHPQGRRAGVREAALAAAVRRPPARRGRGGGLQAAARGRRWTSPSSARSKRKPLSRIKKMSGANLARNWAMIPHVTQLDDADITELEALRVAARRGERKAGVKVTPLAFLIKAAVARAAEVPELQRLARAAARTWCSRSTSTSASPPTRRTAWSCR